MQHSCKAPGCGCRVWWGFQPVHGCMQLQACMALGCLTEVVMEVQFRPTWNSKLQSPPLACLGSMHSLYRHYLLLPRQGKGCGKYFNPSLTPI